MNAPHPPPAPDLRSAEILDHARRAFGEKGFDGASMQDLARAVGMSVGNFYRYFPSKAAIVEAIISRDMEEMEADFSIIIGAEDPRAMLRAAITAHILGDGCPPEDGALWAEINAAAGRKPEIAAIMARMESSVTRNMTTVFARLTGLSEAEAGRRFGAQAALVMLLVKGCAMQRGCAPVADGPFIELVLRTIDRTLDEISPEPVKA